MVTGSLALLSKIENKDIIELKSMEAERIKPNPEKEVKDPSMARTIDPKLFIKGIPLGNVETEWLRQLAESEKLAKGLGYVTAPDDETGTMTYNRLREFAIAQWKSRGLPSFGYPTTDVRLSDQGANILRTMEYLTSAKN